MEKETSVTPGLLLENLPKCDDSAFSLGMSEFLEEPEEPPKKKSKHSLSLRKKGKSVECFANPVTTEDLAVAAKGVVPVNTKNSTEWALRNLNNWMEDRNRKVPGDKVPRDLLSVVDAEVLCKWLCCFVQETRKESGERYPPLTLRQLLCAFQRVLRVNKVAFNILDKTDVRFHDLHNTLDTVCVSLRKQGVGTDVHHAAIISVEQEKRMWDSGVLNLENPEALLRAVFVTVGMHFCLRGGQEHRDLKVDQVSRSAEDGEYSADIYYMYVENGSKNYQGRFSEIGQKNKVVRVYAEPDSSTCPVRILDTYLSKLPHNPPAFYLQWMPKTPKDPSRPWYKRVPVGVNPLKKMMSTISERAGLSVRFTNHSLRAATRMFVSGVPEKIVSEVTGHKSVKALRLYERTTSEQEREAGLAISRLNSFQCSPLVPEMEKENVDYSVDAKVADGHKTAFVKQTEIEAEIKSPVDLKEKLKERRNMLPEISGSPHVILSASCFIDDETKEAKASEGGVFCDGDEEDEEEEQKVEEHIEGVEVEKNIRAGGANVVPLIVKSDESSDSDSEEDPHSLHMFPDVSRNVKSSSMGHEKLSGVPSANTLIKSNSAAMSSTLQQEYFLDDAIKDVGPAQWAFPCNGGRQVPEASDVLCQRALHNHRKKSRHGRQERWLRRCRKLSPRSGIDMGKGKVKSLSVEEDGE